MNTIITTKSAISKSLRLGGMAAAMLFVSLIGLQSAHAAIVSNLELGSSGSEVTELQVYLAKDASIYPEGLVTGYFGALTQAAVQRFQVAQGIVSSGSPDTTGYGRVGPQTRARLSILMGGSVQTSWDAVPVLSVPSVQFSNVSATFTWTTNEATQGQVFYSTLPIQSDEATGPRQTPYVSGTVASDGGSLTSHSITVQGLQPNTTYYYVVRSIDSVGNVSMTLQSSFRSNQY